MALSQFAFLPPLTGHKVIERPRLSAIADQIVGRRLTIVRAPAGYGKTTLLLAWTEGMRDRGHPYIWLSPRAGLDDHASLFDILANGFRTAGFAIGSAAAGVDGLLGAIAMTNRSRPILFIDDAHLLPDAAMSAIIDLVDRGRDLISVIVSTRGRLPMAVARLRALGHLIEIGSGSLRMTEEEISLSCAARLTQTLVPEEIIAIERQTTGWPAGVSLAIEARKGEGCAASVQKIADFFDEEVLASLDAELRAFLSAASLLETLDAEQVAATIDLPQAAETLRKVVDLDLFLQPDEQGNSYKLHPQLRDILAARFSATHEEVAARIHRGAAEHLVQRGRIAAAVRHARQAGDILFFADMLEATAGRLTATSYIGLVEELAADIPWHLLSQRPMILLTIAWAKARRLSFQNAERMIEAAEAAINARRAADPGDAALFELDRMSRHRRIVLAAGRDDVAFVEKASEQLLADMGNDDTFISCTLLAMLMAARRELFHFHDTLRLEAETRRALAEPENDFGSIAFKSTIAPNLILQGKMEIAERFLDEALIHAQSIAGCRSGLAALPALALAELAYSRGQLARARQLVDDHLSAVRQFGFIDHLLAGYLVQARLLVAEGRVDRAIAGLEEAHLVAIEGGLERLRAGVVSEQVRLMVRGGDLERAKRLFDSANLTSGRDLAPTNSATRRDEMVAIAWIRLELAAHRPANARKVARHWLDFVRNNGATQSAVLFQLLLAQILMREDKAGQARRYVRDAIATAAPFGWTQMFIDEGEPIGALLSEAYGEGPVTADTVDTFATRLLHFFSATSLPDEENDGTGLDGNLGNREMQILGLVDAGLRNREIGNRLGLTEGTVKWYMQQIYDKLGVRRRPQAVMRARQLGILA